MANYLWYGEDNTRQLQQGIAPAHTQAELNYLLAQQGIVMHQAYRLWPWHCRYCPMALPVMLVLFKQWSRMLQSGLSISECVRLAMPNKPTLQLRWQLHQLDNRLQQGEQLSQALQQVHLVLAYQGALLDAAEQAGQLSSVMAELAKQQASYQHLLKICRKSLLMPCITLIVGILISIMLLLGLVPNISNLVANGDKAIPMATQWLIIISSALQAHGAMLLQIIGLLVLLSMIGIKLPIVKRKVQPWLKRWLLYGVPVLHKISYQQQLIHLLQMLAVSHSSGVALIKSLDIFNSACHHHTLGKQIKRLRDSLLAGNALSSAFATAGFASPLVTLLKMGERTGELSAVYQQMAEDANSNLQDSMQHMRQLIEPMITLFLALLVGGLVVAIYLPLMQLGSLI